MDSMDAWQIYENFHVLAKGTEGLAAAQQLAAKMQEKYQNGAADSQQMIDLVHSGWTGEAAEAAAQGLGPFAANSLTNSDQHGSAHQVVAGQVDAFHETVRLVQPVPPAPTLRDVFESGLLGNDAQPLLQQISQQHAIQQSNVDAYNGYVMATQRNTSTMPALTERLAVSRVPVTVVPSAAHTQAANSTSQHVTGSENSVNRQDDPAEWRIRAASTRLSNVTNYPLRKISSASEPVITTASGTTNSQNYSPNFPAGRKNDISPFAGMSGATPRTTEGAGPMATRSGVVNFPDENGANSALEPWGRAIDDGERGNNSRPFSEAEPENGELALRNRMSTATPADEALAESTMAGARGVGMPPMGSMSGGRGSSPEREYRRKYRYGPDPQHIFGATKLVAPEVLGESKAQYEERIARQAGQRRR